jgi:hypothetical protein
LGFGGTSFAQIDPGNDSIGLYFDLGGTDYCASVPIVTVERMYLLLTNASCTFGVAGWELVIGYNPNNIWVLAWEYEGLAVNVEDPPQFAVGLIDPLPWTPVLNLLTIEFLVWESTCEWVFLLPFNYYPGEPSEIVYWSPECDPPLISLHQSTGGPDIPVAGINCECPPPVTKEIDTWGAVKTMFR